MAVIVHLGLCLADAHADRGGPPGIGFPGVAISAGGGGKHVLVPAGHVVSCRSSTPAACRAHHPPIPGAPEQQHRTGCHSLVVIHAPVHRAVSLPVPWLCVIAVPLGSGERPAAARAHSPGGLPPAATGDLLCPVCKSLHRTQAAAR